MTRARVDFLHCEAMSPQQAVWDSSRSYPWDELLDAIDAIPEERREQPIGNQALGSMTAQVRADQHGNRLLSVHRVEVGKTESVSTRGAIGTKKYGADEGPTKRTHLYYLEERIMAVVREAGGPNVSQLSSYIGVVAGLEFEPHLNPVKRSNTEEILSSLDEASSITLTLATGEIDTLHAGSSIAKAFRGAEEAITCDEIQLQFKITRPKSSARRRWLSNHRSKLEELVEHGDLELFTAAKAGQTDLLEQLVTAGGYKDIKQDVPDAEVVLAFIRGEYREKRNEIFDVLGIAAPRGDGT